MHCGRLGTDDQYVLFVEFHVLVWSIMNIVIELFYSTRTKQFTLIHIGYMCRGRFLQAEVDPTKIASENLENRGFGQKLRIYGIKQQRNPSHDHHNLF